MSLYSRERKKIVSVTYTDGVFFLYLICNQKKRREKEEKKRANDRRKNKTDDRLLLQEPLDYSATCLTINDEEKYTS